MPRKRLPRSGRPERSTSLRKGPCLESIGENGPLETVLLRQAESGASTGPLIEVLERDLEAMREQAHRIAQEMSASDSNGNLFLVLSSHFREDPFHDRGDAGDPVLLCAIARIEGLQEDFKRLYDAAYEAFRMRPFEYRDALSELLPKEFADIARRIDYSNGFNATAADDFPAFRGRLDSLRALVANRGLIGMPTGISKLDNALCGFHGITFLCAPKGGGKTTLMLSAARATLRHCDDVAVLLLSFDQSKDRIYERLLCMEAGISYRQLRDPDPVAQRRLEQAEPKLLPLLARMKVAERRVRYPIREQYSDEVLRHQGYDLEALHEDLDALLSATRANNLLLCVDLFQKWPVAEDVAAGADADHFRLDVLDSLRSESLSRGCPGGYPMLVLSELRKDAPHDFDIDDLKGDGRMTSDADCVLLMYPASDRPDLKAESVPMTIKIAKGRDGVERIDVPAWFDFRHSRFLDHAPKQGGDQPSARSEANNVRTSGRPSRRRGPMSGSSNLDPLAE